MGRLLGLMIFCIGIGIVIGMLIQENVVIIVTAGLLPFLWWFIICSAINNENRCFIALFIVKRKEARENSRALLGRSYIIRNYALSTFPDLRQEVHTYIFCAPPLAVLTLTDFTLDFPHFYWIFYGNDLHYFRNKHLFHKLRI